MNRELISQMLSDLFWTAIVVLGCFSFLEYVRHGVISDFLNPDYLVLVILFSWIGNLFVKKPVRP